ncbi:MAG: hypothetical protein ED557_07645 [Balneola sp.]|nr:MAG: hypothetical protein ED557_07645 [Balneola sp.]
MDFIRKYLLHFLLWSIYFTLFFFVANEQFTLINALLVASIITFVHASIFYVNYTYLIPSLYFRGKNLLYLFSVVIVLCTFVFIGAVALEGLIQPQPVPLFMMNNPNDFSSVEPPIFLRLIPISVPAIMLLMVSFILKKTEHSQLVEQELEQLKTQNFETELKFLRSQINPHFLFNSLNNIYSLSVTKSEKTPDMLVKLSSMLRYLIYECNVDKVSLEKEIEYISNYIELQKLKDDQISNIHFNHQGNNAEISPMLLMPFVENAFKHSKIEDTDKSWIDISLEVKESGKLCFKVENSIPPIPTTKDETGGVGIANVKKRLQLLYPERHSINFFEDIYQYKIELSIELNGTH